jgi:hypothetical protein
MSAGPSRRADAAGEVASRADVCSRDRASADNGVVSSGAEEAPRVFRRGGISYLRVPAKDPRESASFYAGVFGSSVDTDREDPSFEDGTGHVIGHFMADLPVAGEARRPAVCVCRERR